MVLLYQLPGAWGVSSVSPFCVKLEAYLRMAKVPFEVRFGDPRKAPRGKVPWIDDEGTIVCDSQRAIRYLADKRGADLDAGLKPDDKARGHALRRMLEEGTYFAMVWLRWGEPGGWEVYKPVLAQFAPPLIAGPTLWFIRRQVLGQVWGQGTGRFEREEMFQLAKSDFAVLATVLADKPYFFGKEPTSFDATAYAFIASVLAFPAESPPKTFIEGTKNLVAYRNRIKARFFDSDPK